MPKDGNLYQEYVTRLYIQPFHRRLDDKTPTLIIQSNPLHRRVEEVVNIQGALTDRTLQALYESVKVTRSTVPYTTYSSR